MQLEQGDQLTQPQDSVVFEEVSSEEIDAKICAANPWWQAEEDLKATVASLPFNELTPRKYFQLFSRLAASAMPNRAIILMGPRRVGKTVMVFHLFKRLIEKGRKASKQLIYLDLQQPIYGRLGLEPLLNRAMAAGGITERAGLVVCFDEIQYLKDWELHLKTLVDDYPEIQFIGTGSAAAALRLKSQESGAGRFTDFLLPPLTFYEYLHLVGDNDLVRRSRRHRKTSWSSPDVDALNDRFIRYLNFGGYPESALSPTIQANLGRYIQNDIIDKVLLKDLPNLYGIQDIQELNALFASLAYNTSNAVSLSSLSQNSGVAANTIKKYIEYLESAFLIKVIRRVDQSAKRFQRAREFKVYLTNPSMRAALFSPITPDSGSIGGVVETAVFAQWFHSLHSELHYARWDQGKGGEVDIVYLDNLMKPMWAVEVKWSDAFEENPSKLTSLRAFAAKHPDCKLQTTTRSKQSSKRIDERDCVFTPSALYCYILGLNIIKSREAFELEPED